MKEELMIIEKMIEVGKVPDELNDQIMYALKQKDRVKQDFCFNPISDHVSFLDFSKSIILFQRAVRQMKMATLKLEKVLQQAEAYHELFGDISSEHQVREEDVD